MFVKKRPTAYQHFTCHIRDLSTCFTETTTQQKRQFCLLSQLNKLWHFRNDLKCLLAYRIIFFMQITSEMREESKQIRRLIVFSSRNE